MLEKRGRTVRSENGDLRRCQFRGDRLAACDGKVAKGGLRKFSGPSAWLEKPSPERPDAGTPVRPPVAARPCIPRARLLLFQNRGPSVQKGPKYAARTGEDHRDGTPGTGGSSPISHHVPPPRGECKRVKGHRAGQSFAPLAKSRSSLSRRTGTRKRLDRAQFGASFSLIHCDSISRRVQAQG